ncbi:MAG: type II toxin-antitoxin system prevent-host-death family antitoxin [Verrucomicrobia bacterium]|nr:type II toxin-antitoxin system prevent-host-death family antitoxin [Verrucomicrobiota bacterium]
MKPTSLEKPEPTHIGAFAAKTNLARLLRQTRAGKRFIITSRGQPVAMLEPMGVLKRPSAWGDMKGKIWMADDFCAPLAEFREYME